MSGDTLGLGDMSSSLSKSSSFSSAWLSRREAVVENDESSPDGILHDEGERRQGAFPEDPKEVSA
jgi:hypothetical protein